MEDDGRAHLTAKHFVPCDHASLRMRPTGAFGHTVPPRTEPAKKTPLLSIARALLVARYRDALISRGRRAANVRLTSEASSFRRWRAAVDEGADGGVDADM